MITNELTHGAVTMEVRLIMAVGAAPGTVGGMGVDIRHYQTYLHVRAALL
ncbi:hypothetical protein [Rubrobacter xylanophilus]|nr:hypothetical protein [Rubrobacter xylanophilus]